MKKHPRKMVQVPFQRRSDGGGEEGKANATIPVERSFTSTQPVPVGFPESDDLLQAEITEPDSPLQKASSNEDVKLYYTS